MLIQKFVCAKLQERRNRQAAFDICCHKNAGRAILQTESRNLILADCVHFLNLPGLVNAVFKKVSLVLRTFKRIGMTVNKESVSRSVMVH